MLDRRLAISGAMCAALSLGATPSFGQSYPTKPIKVIVPFAAGGGTDMVARAVTQRMSNSMKASFFVENRPGANANLGNEIAARAEPDGYTLLMTSSSLTINPGLYKSLSYNPVKDFTPVGLATYVPLMLVVHPSLGVDTLQQFVQVAKSGRLISFGSAGAGNVTHLAMEQLKLLAGINVQHVPYRGTSQALQDLLGNQVQAIWGTIPPTLPLVRGGRLKALAVGSAKRIKAAPDLPSVTELGYPDLNAATWFGLLAPAGTPKPIVDLLNKELNKALVSPQLNEVLTAEGAEPAGNTPEEFTAFIAAEVAKWQKVISAAGIEPQ